jgi:hypothetical protein
MPMLEGRVDAVIGGRYPPRPPRRRAAGPQRWRAGHPPGAKRPGRPCPAAAAGRCPGPRPAGLGAGGDRLLGGRADPVSGRPGEWVVEIDRPKRPRGRHGPRAMCWTLSEPAATPSPATTWPAHASAGIGRRSGCCTPPAPPSWRPARTLARQLKALIVTGPRPVAGRPARTPLAAAGPRLRGAGGRPRRSGGAPRHRAGVAHDRSAGPGRPCRGKGA